MANWSPLHATDPFKFNFGSYGLIVLNTPINLPPDAVKSLWTEAKFRSTVDGGTNRWFKYLEENNVTLDRRFPDTVSGDFDSVTQNALDLCRSNGVYVEHTLDQDYTDFQKALALITKRCETKLDAVVVLVGSDGRLDQMVQNLNTIGMASTFLGKTETPAIYLLNDQSITWYLHKGSHTISIPSYLSQKSAWCALIPYEPVKNHINTTGLKWNLSGDSIFYGGLISTSNTYSGHPTVSINTDSGIIWSMGFEK